MKKFFLLVFALLPAALALAQSPSTSSSAASSSVQCRPQPTDGIRVVGTGPIKTVVGPLADFDPCHHSVRFDFPGFFATKREGKTPVIIIAHGGGGVGGYELDFARLMNRHGFATLVFDALQMNGLTSGSDLVLYQIRSAARQRMIFKATWGAYQWLLASDRIDTSRMFVKGLSSGGSVAINMASAADPRHLRAVVAEGAPSAGIGFPDEVKVPLLMIYGAADNYGGSAPEDWIYARDGPCLQNDFDSLAPRGFAEQCNQTTASEGRLPSPIKWFESVNSRGPDLRFELVQGAGHGMLFSSFSGSVIPLANGRKFYRSHGASAGERQRVQAMILAFFESKL